MWLPKYDVLGQPFEVHDGPEDHQIRIAGINVRGDANRDFVIEKEGAQFDRERRAVHTYGTVRKAIDFWRGVHGKEFVKTKRDKDGDNRLSIWFEGLPGVQNAYFSPRDNELRFGYWLDTRNSVARVVDPDSKLGSWVVDKIKGSKQLQNWIAHFDQKNVISLADSWDVGTHEAGHFILHSVRPDWLATWHVQTGGTHEAFGDLTAMWAALQEPRIRTAILHNTKGDLHNHNAVATLAEQFGDSIGRKRGLRNALNDVKLTDVSWQVHDNSRVLSGVMYDVTVDTYNHNLVRQKFQDHDRALADANGYTAGLFWHAVLKAPQRQVNYSDLGKLMITKAEEDGRYDVAQSIKDRFRWRHIFGEEAKNAASNQPWAHGIFGTEGTLGLPELNDLRGPKPTPPPDADAPKTNADPKN